LRELRLDDYPQVAALQIRNGLPAKTPADWNALWAENPACRAPWPLGWMLETPQGEAVGALGNIPLTYRFRGQELIAATATSWAVDPEYRGYSMMVFQAFVRQAADLLVCTSVSPAVEPLLRAFRFSRAPLGDWQRAGFWITGVLGFTRSALIRKCVPHARLVSYPAAAILSAGNVLYGRRSWRAYSGLEIEFCAGFDERFETFWQEQAALSPFVLLADRSRATLAWHYRLPMARKQLWIVTASKASRLLGYAVFDRQDQTAIGLRRMRLVDAQILRDTRWALKAMLQRALERCRAEDIHSLEVTGSMLDPRSRIKADPPYRRALAAWSYYYKAADSGLAEALRDPAVWIPSSYDGDASL
jgi:hypothetical protein